MRLKSTLHLFLLFTLLHTNLFAQNFWVPDANFRNKLKQLYPTCFTAQDSMITTCTVLQAATTLNVTYSMISSLDGIQYFTSLDTLICSFNNLSNIPVLPTSLKYLNCAFNQLTNLQILPPFLTFFQCNNNLSISLPALPNSLTDLICNNCNLYYLPALPISLTNLICSNNQLTNLPILPITLSILWCTKNFLTGLPTLPPNLINLNCAENLLIGLPILPATLTKLYCNKNQLTNLPALPATLTHLYCNQNQLSNLPTLPTSMTHLYCYSNQLTILPSLPISISDLFCQGNQLITLPSLPSSLVILICGNNQLTSLPILPNSLLRLECSYNQLSYLPILPSFLTELTCFKNKLSSLPALPDSLINIICDHNQLSSLPRIPGKVNLLSCRSNPITCFPDIAPRIIGSLPWNNIIIDSTLISCIPNSVNFLSSVVNGTQTLPFCNPSNSDCNFNFTMGYVFNDTNGNGMKDSLEHGLAIPVYYSGNSGAFSNSSGIFYATSDTGNISFQVAIPPYYTATTATTQTINVVSGIVDTLYFGLQPIPNIKDLRVDLTSIGFLRPGFKAKYKLHYQNVGTDTLYNVQVKFLKPIQLSNLSSQPTANSVNGDTLIWNIASLIPYHQGDVVISDSVFANAVLGDTARAYAWIEPLVGDTTPLNNSAISTNIIRGAYDPNDKSVSVDSVLPNSTDNLEYTIRFQNTGTDTAFTVTLLDKLSTLLDIRSIQMISASHSYELSIVNGFAKWVFINILLPDSNTNELESHGFVKFRIKPLPGLTVADSIPNEADIYFDYNVAVTTNTIVVNVVNPLQVQELKETELQIFPNPVQDILRIVNQQAGALGKIELINANGKVLETKTISTSTYTWNIQHLSAGTYILKGQGWGQKLVKE